MWRGRDDRRASKQASKRESKQASQPSHTESRPEGKGYESTDKYNAERRRRAGEPIDDRTQTQRRQRLKKKQKQQIARGRGGNNNYNDNIHHKELPQLPVNQPGSALAFFFVLVFPFVGLSCLSRCACRTNVCLSLCRQPPRLLYTRSSSSPFPFPRLHHPRTRAHNPGCRRPPPAPTPPNHSTGTPRSPRSTSSSTRSSMLIGGRDGSPSWTFGAASTPDGGTTDAGSSSAAAASASACPKRQKKVRPVPLSFVTFFYLF